MLRNLKDYWKINTKIKKDDIGRNKDTWNTDEFWISCMSLEYKEYIIKGEMSDKNNLFDYEFTWTIKKLNNEIELEYFYCFINENLSNYRICDLSIKEIFYN